MKKIFPLVLLSLNSCGTIQQLNDLVNDSTCAIYANREAVQESTQAIEKNGQLIDSSTQTMKENLRQIKSAK